MQVGNFWSCDDERRKGCGVTRRKQAKEVKITPFSNSELEGLIIFGIQEEECEWTKIEAQSCVGVAGIEDAILGCDEEGGIHFSSVGSMRKSGIVWFLVYLGKVSTRLSNGLWCHEEKPKRKKKISEKGNEERNESKRKPWGVRIESCGEYHLWWCEREAW